MACSSWEVPELCRDGDEAGGPPRRHQAAARLLGIDEPAASESGELLTTGNAVKAPGPPSSATEEFERVRTADQDPEGDIQTQADPDSEGDLPTQADQDSEGNLQMHVNQDSEVDLQLQLVPQATARLVSEEERPRLESVVRRMHDRSGHSPQKRFLKLPRLSGARSVVIAIAKASRCPLCEKRHRPGPPRSVGPPALQAQSEQGQQQIQPRAPWLGRGSRASAMPSAVGPPAAFHPAASNVPAGPTSTTTQVEAGILRNFGSEQAWRNRQSQEAQDQRIWFCSPETLGAPPRPAASWPAAGSRFWPLEEATPETQ